MIRVDMYNYLLTRCQSPHNIPFTPRPRTAPLRPAMTRRNDPDVSETVALILMGAASLYLCIRIIPTLLFMWGWL